MKKPQSHLLILAATLGGALVWPGPAGAHAAPRLDPFGPRPAKSWSPFHVAQAEEAPTPAPAKAEPNHAAAHEPASTQPAVRPAETSVPAAALHGQTCTRDEDCPVSTICQSATCQPFDRPIDVLLYRKGGRSTAVIPFYWSQRDNPGYRVLAPVYFHFWGPESHTQIVAPFYWRVEDHLKQRVVLVIPPYVRTTQPDARSWAIWPFFYLSTKFGWAAPLLASFAVGNPDQGNAVGMWFLLYFWKNTATSKFDLIFPLAVSTRSKESAFTYAVPLNFYWRTGDEKNLLSVPFFYRSSKPSGGNFASLLGYSSVENRATTGSFLWLYWYGRSQASSYDVLFPLLWSFRSPGANTTIFPPLFHFRSGGSSLGTFALLGWWASDKKAGSSWQLVLPFYFHKTGAHGATALHLWPFGSYRRDDQTGARSLTMLVPPILHWRDKSGQLDFDILYYRHHDIPSDGRTTIVGPYYHRDDPAGATRALFPLVWYFRDSASGATAHAVLPLYFHRHAPDEKLTAAGIFPFWGYYRSFSDGGFSAGFFPFAFFGSRGDKRHAVVFPLFWHRRSADSTSTLVMPLLLPLFYTSADKASAKTFIFPALYFSGRNNDESYRIQFPFYWNFVHGRSGVALTLAPFYFHYRDTKGYAAGIPPILFWGGGGQRRHFAFFPLFWWFRDDAQDRTTTVVANYLHRRDGGETTDAFFPLFHYRRGSKAGGSPETSLTLFPLFHYRKSADWTLFASPLGAWTRTAAQQAGFVGPYFWYRNAAFAVRGVPLLYLDHTQLDTGKRTRMWGPYLALDCGARKTRVLFPFWAHHQSEQETGTYVFPTYYRRQTSDGYHLDTLFPLLWLSHSPTSHTTVVGPYFTHHAPTGSASGVLPFYVASQSPKRSLFISPLFASYTNHQSGSSRAFSWLYYQSKHGDDMFRVAFPLWWQWRDSNAHTAVGFPLFWHFTNNRANTSTTVLGPLFWSQHESERTRGLLLAWYSRDAQKASASHAFAPFFYERHSPTSLTFFATPLFGYHRDGENRWWYAGNFFWRDNWKESFNAFVPLWFHHRNKMTEKHTLVIPPLLHYASTSPEKSLSTWLLLFWRRSDITSSTTVGLPLVYDFHSYHQSRLTMALPLFLRYRNDSSQQTYTVAPLFYRRSSPTDSTTIGLPLLWRFWSEERSTTVVFPFYVGVKRSTFDASYVFPNIYYRKGLGAEAGTSHLFVFPFWESQIKRPGDYMWEALLGMVGWERIGRNRFLKLLFIPFELEAAPAAKTAWYGKPPARSREHMARSIDIKSW